ncbi:hypothetical protein B7H18_05895 [Pseudomonas putida]|nr:hypothetical protein B7H18_05895 [Pseudomonas putida]
MQFSCPDRYCIDLKSARYLWERACPRRVQRGAWHRLRRCSRLKPLPQGPRADLWERLVRTRYLPSTTGYAGRRRWPRHRTRTGCSSACRTGCWR